MERFSDLLRRLEQARRVDEDLHSRGGSLADRAASRQKLAELRAEIALVRVEAGFEAMEVSGRRDSRNRRGIGGE